MKIKNRDKELDVVEQFTKNEKEAPRLVSQDEDGGINLELSEEFDCLIVDFSDDYSDDLLEDDADYKKLEHKMNREKKQETRRALHYFLFPVRYCTACGASIRRTDEIPAVWSKIRRCAECVKENRQSTRNQKFCSSCGKNLARELKKACDWRTKAVCATCAGTNKEISETLVYLLHLADKGRLRYMRRHNQKYSELP